MLTFAMSFMLLSTSAMAVTFHVDSKKDERARVENTPRASLRHAPVSCRFAEPRCDRRDEIRPERYGNDQKMYSRGECHRGDKVRRFDFYCSNGDVWMQIDYRRDRPDRIDCKDPRHQKFFAVRSIRECEDIYDDYNRPRDHHRR